MPVAIKSAPNAHTQRTDEMNWKAVSKLRSLILIMLAINRGGAWECKRPRVPFQNSHFFSFSLGT